MGAAEHSIQSRIGTDPEMLIIQLKRFAVRDLNVKMVTFRVDHSTIIPFDLSLRVYGRESPAEYRLVACVVSNLFLLHAFDPSFQHQRGELERGHYWAFFRLNETWYRAEDQNISISGQDVFLEYIRQGCTEGIKVIHGLDPDSVHSYKKRKTAVGAYSKVESDRGSI